MCSQTHATPEQILAWFVGRWNIEGTFEAIRAHLGFETQRHGSVRAIERTTPCLLGLFRLVVLMAKALPPTSLPVQRGRWYTKDEATFRDVLAAVRRHLWGAMNNTISPRKAQTCLIPEAIWQRVLYVLAYAA